MPSYVACCWFHRVLFSHRFADSKYELASIQNGGFLKIYQVDSNQDAGTYTCIVRNRGGEEARREMELTVNSM